MGAQDVLARWCVGLGSAIMIKLSSSIDDVVWLAPFLTANSSVAARLSNSSIYIGVCLVQTVVAYVIAFAGSTAVKAFTQATGAGKSWTTEKILTVGAGCMLACYTVKLLHEYIQEMGEEGGEEGGEGDQKERGEYAQVSTEPGAEGAGLEMAEMGENGKDPNGGAKSEEEPANAKSQTLFVIAFIGSVDDLTLFVPMLVGKSFDIVQLMVGAFTAASAIVLICIFLGMCKPIADCLEKIPLFLIVGIFSVCLLSKAFLFAPDGGDGSP